MSIVSYAKYDWNACTIVWHRSKCSKYGSEWCNKNVSSKIYSKAASGLLSALPKDITDQFGDNDKQKFKTTQDNVNRYDLLKQLSEITGIKDIDKLDSFADVILDSLKQNTRIDMSDGIDKEELLQGLKDLSRQQQSSQF